MAEANMAGAKALLGKFEAYLNQLSWKFGVEEDGDDITIKTGAVGNDLSMEMRVRIDARRELVSVYSQLPFYFDKDKIVDGSVATSMINNGLTFGGFDFDVSNGATVFRLTTSWAGDVELSDKVFKYLLFGTATTVDEYNDKLLMIAKGLMNLDQLMEFLQNN